MSRLVTNVAEDRIVSPSGKIKKKSSLEDKDLKKNAVRRFKSSGMTPFRLVYSYGSIFTNMNGVTSPENILIVITGIRITSLVRNIISRWLLGALPRNLNQTHTLLYKYVTFNSEDHFSSAAVFIVRTETRLL
jgi:hypothetical protein